MDILWKELRVSAILVLSGVHPEIFLTPLPPSVRRSGRCICANELSASGEITRVGAGERSSFFFSERAIKALPFLLIDLPFESCMCSQELKKQSMRQETMEKKI